MSMLDDMIEVKRILEKNRPPRLEIWVTELVPERGTEGKPFICKINIDEFASFAFPGLARLGIHSQRIPTVTNAEEIIMMHPATYNMLQNHEKFREMTSGLFAVPVFDDKQRREYFAHNRPTNAATRF